MGLSCECYFGDYDYEFMYMKPDDYTTLQTSKRKRCYSCKSLIGLGAVCVEFTCHRPFNSDIEERIYGDEVPIADKHFCETCSDIYFSLDALGFCISLGNMHDLLNEYHEDYGKSNLDATTA